MITRNWIPPKYVCHGLYLYFSGLSLRRTSERLSYFFKRNPISIWNWIQKYKPQRISYSRRKITEYIVDEAIIKVGAEYIWLWVAIEPKDRENFSISTSKERYMFVAERFIAGLVKIHGRHPVCTDGETWYLAYRFLKPRHHLHHSPFEKSIVERIMQHIKYRIECFDDYFPCRKIRCKLMQLTIDKKFLHWWSTI